MYKKSTTMKLKTHALSILATIIALFFSVSAHAQKEGNIWYFGDGDGLNFNQPFDILDNSSAVESVEGVVSISAPDGTLLFYSNGGGRFNTGQYEGTIWNRNHEVMYDMMGMEGGGWSSQQSALAIPKPNDENNYYLFTTDEFEWYIDGTPNRGFSYFEIDMELEGGLGAVVDYQESVLPFVFEGLAGVRHTNGNDYWVVVQDSVTSAFHFFLADGSGFNLDHTQSPPPGPLFDDVPIVFSPNGTKIFAGNFVADFDASTGFFSNPQILPDAPYGASFSPNSRYLYMTMTEFISTKLVRYDTEATDVVASEETLVDDLEGVNFPGGLQVAPDGNIYLIEQAGAVTFDEYFVSAILCPNSDSPCYRPNVYTFESEVEDLPVLGLPNFTNHYFINDEVTQSLDILLSADPLQICPGEEVTLSASHYLAETYTWSNGESGQSIIITEPGIYSVTISDGCCGIGTAEVEITSNVPGELEVEITGGDVICDGQALTLTAESPTGMDFSWSNGSTDSTTVVNEIGFYSVTVTDACDATVSSEIEITLPDSLEYELESIGALACADEVRLSANANTEDITWSTGEMGEEITVTEAGTYTVTLSNGCETQTETFEVLPDGTPFEIPNVFTPNGDGVNDRFNPVWRCDQVASFDMIIFNRWGEEVFQTTDPFLGWDGQQGGEPAISDVFVFRLNYEGLDGEVIEAKGDVTLLR